MSEGWKRHLGLEHGSQHERQSRDRLHGLIASSQVSLDVTAEYELAEMNDGVQQMSERNTVGRRSSGSPEGRKQ